VRLQKHLYLFIEQCKPEPLGSELTAFPFLSSAQTGGEGIKQAHQQFGVVLIALLALVRGALSLDRLHKSCSQAFLLFRLLK